MADSNFSGDAVAFDVGAALDSGRWTATHSMVLLLVASAIILDGFDNQVLGIAAPAILRDWSTTRDALAPVFAMGFIGMVVGTLIGGWLGDRVGRRPTLALSVVVFGLATGSTALVDSVTGLGICRTVAGLGLGSAMPCATTLLAEFAPARRRSLMVTLGIVCIPLGGVFGGLIAAKLLPALGWRSLFAIGGCVPLIVAFLLLTMLPESPRYLLGKPSRRGELDRLLARLGHGITSGRAFALARGPDRAETPQRILLSPAYRSDTLALWGAFFACLLTTYIVFSWAPTLLAQNGFDLSITSLALAVFNIGGVVGAVAAAALVPRIGSRAIMLAMAAGGVAGAIALALLPSGATPGLLLLGVLAIEGGFINAAQTSLYGLAAHIYPAPQRSTGVGAAAGVGRVGAVVSSFIGAAVLGGGWPAFFSTLALGMALTFLALALIRRHVVPEPERCGMNSAAYRF